MKPYRILLLFLGILIVVGSIGSFFPNNRIVINDRFSVKFPTIQGLLKASKPKYADITVLSKNNKSDTIVVLKKSATTHHRDTIPHPAVSQFLDYPDSTKTSLDPFFRMLSGISSSAECLHILHYGDSQLEADRISEYLRFRFQAEFGGNGPGLLSFYEETDRNSMQITNSGNWSRFSLIGTPFKHQVKRAYGPLASFFRFTPAGDSSCPEHTMKEAWIKIQGAGRSFGKTHHFGRCRIFYSNGKVPVQVTFLADDQFVKNDTVVPGARLGILDCTIKSTPSDLLIKFTGTQSPDFYGICLDDPNGISVDNIPLRGSSGLEFTRMDPALLSEMVKQLNTGLLIFQFGVNAIPGNLSDYSHYENGMYRQLSHLKKIHPDLCIIVISVSDASQKIGDSYETYSSVEKIVAAQQAAAKRAGCVFWNLYQAMGGRNSMPSWVFAKEPLASTDFLHFNYQGARMVARMFYSALINDYNTFLKQQR